MERLVLGPFCGEKDAIHEGGVKGVRRVRSFVGQAPRVWGVLPTMHVIFVGLPECAKPEATWPAKNGARSRIGHQHSLMAAVDQGNTNSLSRAV